MNLLQLRYYENIDFGLFGYLPESCPTFAVKIYIQTINSTMCWLCFLKIRNFDVLKIYFERRAVLFVSLFKKVKNVPRYAVDRLRVTGFQSPALRCITVNYIVVLPLSKKTNCILWIRVVLLYLTRIGFFSSLATIHYIVIGCERKILIPFMQQLNIS